MAMFNLATDYIGFSIIRLLFRSSSSGVYRGVIAVASRRSRVGVKVKPKCTRINSNSFINVNIDDGYL